MPIAPDGTRLPYPGEPGYVEPQQQPPQNYAQMLRHLLHAVDPTAPPPARPVAKPPAAQPPVSTTPPVRTTPATPTTPPVAGGPATGGSRPPSQTQRNTQNQTITQNQTKRQSQNQTQRNVQNQRQTQNESNLPGMPAWMRDGSGPPGMPAWMREENGRPPGQAQRISQTQTQGNSPSNYGQMISQIARGMVAANGGGMAGTRPPVAGGPMITQGFRPNNDAPSTSPPTPGYGDDPEFEAGRQMARQLRSSMGGVRNPFSG